MDYSGIYEGSLAQEMIATDSTDPKEAE